MIENCSSFGYVPYRLARTPLTDILQIPLLAILLALMIRSSGLTTFSAASSNQAGSTVLAQEAVGVF